MYTAQFLSYRPDKDREGAGSQKSGCSCYHPAAQRPQQQSHAGKHAVDTLSQFTVSKLYVLKVYSHSTIAVVIISLLLECFSIETHCWVLFNLDIVFYLVIQDCLLGV